MSESTANPELLEAAVLQWTWKTPAMQTMALAVLRLALSHGVSEFSANDLPEFDHGGRGVAGVIFHRLVHDGVLSPVGALTSDGKFFPKTIHNAGGNRIGVYRLKNYSLARRLMEVHGGTSESPQIQEEMALA